MQCVGFGAFVVVIRLLNAAKLYILRPRTGGKDALGANATTAEITKFDTQFRASCEAEFGM